METEKLYSMWDQIQSMFLEYAPKLGLAIVLLIVGLRIANKIAKLAAAAMKRAGVSENILPFISSMVGIGIKVLLIFTVAQLVGIETTSFVAVLAAAGFAVGLALQGSLSNFAAGIIILIFRPYKVGQWIEVDDKFGKVEEIQVFNTLIVTPGAKTLIIPNAQVVENIVTNYSHKGHIRLELTISMPYAESFPKVKQIIEEVLSTTPGVLSEPAPEVGIESFDSHTVILGIRPYVHPDDYWEVTFEVHQRVKTAFSVHGIEMAYSEGVELGKIGD